MNKVISRDGTAIAYDQTGNGPAVILVGGALTQRSVPEVGSLADLLAPHFTAIGYDRRGRGDSGDTAPYAVRREVEDIEALIDQAGGYAYLYGHSSGGVLALEAARVLGDKVCKAAIYEPPFMAGGDDPQLYAMHLARMRELLRENRREDMLMYWLADVTGTPAQYYEPMKNTPMWYGLLAVVHTTVYDLAIMDEYAKPAERIRSLRLPVLVMDGGASPQWAARAAQLVADTIPNAQRRTLAGQTHGADPKLLAPILVEFFEQAEAAPQPAQAVRNVTKA